MTAEPADTLRARFEAELLTAGLELTGADYEAVFAMWRDHLAVREKLRAVVFQPDDEPWP